MGKILDCDWSRQNLLRSDWSVPKGATITTLLVHLLLRPGYVGRAGPLTVPIKASLIVPAVDCEEAENKVFFSEVA